MPTPFTLGAQNADRVFGLFADGDVTFLTVAINATTADTAVAHGLSGTPDFVFLSTNTTDDAAGAAAGVGWSANATTLTITQQTAGNATVSVIAGNLS